ncbi:MAG: sigma-70 family RNA polymerase sigma factor [Flavobacteriales bacterium]|nr:sigma-70 family RNA polymerase sigma factor [Flavobacteriales bacterium]
MSEEETWITAAKKNVSDFEPLYRRYHEKIFRFIYNRVSDEDLAYDTTSEVFLKAMLKIDKFKFKGLPFSSWLYRIAANTVKDLYKANKTRQIISADTPGLHLIAESISFEEKEEKEIHIQWLTESIADLPEEDIQLITMRFFEKRPFKEIGEILNLTETNAKVRLYRILDKMKKQSKHIHS